MNDTRCDPYTAYLCSSRGYHVTRGVGTGTSATTTVWSDHCRDCGAKL